MVFRSQSFQKTTFYSRELKKSGKIQSYLITASFPKNSQSPVTYRRPLPLLMNAPVYAVLTGNAKAELITDIVIVFYAASLS